MTNTEVRIAQEIVDEVSGQTGQGYYLTQVVRLSRNLGSHDQVFKVRVEIMRDSYAKQSYARVSVLTPELTWTVLSHEDRDDFYNSTPSFAKGIVKIKEAIGDFPVCLLDRAEMILFWRVSMQDLAFARDQKVARLFAEAVKTAVIRARGERRVTISFPDRRAGRSHGRGIADWITDVAPAPDSSAAASLSLHEVSPVSFELVW
jgi:hypothetical protein